MTLKYFEKTLNSLVSIGMISLTLQTHMVLCKVIQSVVNINFCFFQDDKAFREKQKEESKKLKEMQQRAAKGGPLGKLP